MVKTVLLSVKELKYTWYGEINLNKQYVSAVKKIFGEDVIKRLHKLNALLPNMKKLILYNPKR